MDAFHVDENLKSCAYPIIKIVICLGLIVLFIFRGYIIFIDNKIINVIVGVLFTGIGVACIYYIYISAFELSQIHENRKNIKMNNSSLSGGKEYAVEHIVAMANDNDIIEIHIASNDKIINIGSSSDCKNYNSKFFNKRYYINEMEFESIDEFETSLLPYSNNGQITVISIDGMGIRRGIV